MPTLEDKRAQALEALGKVRDNITQAQKAEQQLVGRIQTYNELIEEAANDGDDEAADAAPARKGAKKAQGA